MLKKTNQNETKRCTRLYLVLLLLYFIFADEASETALFKLSSTMVSSSFWLVLSLAGFQVIFATLQASFSDYYSRRKSLILSVIITLISLILLKFSKIYGGSFLIFALALKGIGGNTLPIARAGLADVTLTHNFRFVLALSICAIALGSWGPTYFASYIGGPALCNFVIAISGISLMLILLNEFDEKEAANKVVYGIADDNVKSKIVNNLYRFGKIVRTDFNTIYHDFLRKPIFVVALMAYFFAEVSFYQILFRLEVLANYFCFFNVPIELGIGYYVGTAILKFSTLKNKPNVVLGVVVSLVCIFLLLIFSFLKIEIKIINGILFGVYSLGFAIFIPSLFSSISNNRTPNVQGKIYGLIESADVFAEIAAFALVFSLKKISCTTVLLLSTSLFVLCAISFYGMFRINRFTNEK